MSFPVFKAGRRGARRYRMEQDENKIIRFASAKNRRISTTQIFDISESGVSFTTALKIAPHIGEIIRMDFSPMAGLQIACTGRVVRIEEPTKNAGWAKFPDTVKIGVSFYNMPRAYRRSLAESLKLAFKYQDQPTYSKRTPIDFNLNLDLKNSWLYQNLGSVLFTILLLGGLAVGGYYLLTSTESSQHQEKAPWAEGFFNKVIDRPKH
jgi:hypothetical protein